MKRASLLLAAAAAASALFLVGWSARPAFACTGPGALQAMLETPVILEGRVVTVTALPQDNLRPAHSPYALAIEVVQGHVGAKAGDRVEAVAYLPDPGVPQACASFEFQGDLTGQYLVIGLQPPQTPGGRMLAERGAASFVGAAPVGADYQRGHALAEMMADSNPAAPRLTLVPSSPACGETFRAKGERFAPGKYILRPAFEGRILALANVGASGTFDVSARMVTSWCSGKQINGRVVGIHVWAIDPSSPEPPATDALTEIAPVLVSGARNFEPGSPVLRVSPQTARCGDEVAVAGAGFLPEERLNIGFGVAPPDREAIADAAGNVAFQFRLPGGECAADRYRSGLGFNQVWATQAEFGLPGPYFSLASGEVYLMPLDSPGPTSTGVPPGPPDAGSGPRSASGREAASSFKDLLLGAGAAVVGLGVLGTGIRVRRQRRGMGS
jgi:hypothetical protein